METSGGQERKLQKHCSAIIDWNVRCCLEEYVGSLSESCGGSSSQEQKESVVVLCSALRASTDALEKRLAKLLWLFFGIGSQAWELFCWYKKWMRPRSVFLRRIRGLFIWSGEKAGCWCHNIISTATVGKRMSYDGRIRLECQMEHHYFGLRNSYETIICEQNKNCRCMNYCRRKKWQLCDIGADSIVSWWRGINTWRMIMKRVQSDSQETSGNRKPVASRKRSPTDQIISVFRIEDPAQ